MQGRVGTRILFVAAMMALAPLAALAQLTDSFEGAGGTAPDLSGWTFSPPVGGVGWKVDGLELGEAPLGQVGVGPGTAVFAGAGSLNYNDDTDFDNGATNSGNALSPVLTVTGTPITVTFQCNYHTETTGTTFDQRFMEVIDPGTGLVVAGGTFQMAGTAAAPLTCSAQGTWHSHTIDITTAVGALTSFQVRFRFASVDGIGNAFDGWFLDDVSVTNVCIDDVAPSTPSLISPVGGACIASPALLDWTDATDTSPCGAGTIAGYNIEVAADAGFTVILASAFITGSSATLSGPSGTYFWRVQAVDGGGNVSSFTPGESFFLDAPVLPSAPDTLFVNEPADGAQAGDAGFVDPVTSVRPVFSAIYRDPNCGDNAVSYRMQVSTDPTFLTTDFDSTLTPFVTPVPKDARCPDLAIGVDLQRDTVYYWRVQFADGLGVGAFSSAQSFHIGDDFDFGERQGSSHHGRRCYVATASFSAASPVVTSLARFRGETLEASGAGQAASRTYGTLGAAAASRSGSVRGPLRWVLQPVASGASSPGSLGLLLAAALGALLTVAVRRR